MSLQVRPFRRSDREQLTDLINLHVAAVVPGASVSVNTVLSQLEREPGEFIVDRWVSDRTTLVADHRGRVVAAAHLCRYSADESVGSTYRDTGEIKWLVCWPPAPYWPDSLAAGTAVVSAALSWMQASGAVVVHADGALPAPGVYGIPEQWPHIRTLLLDAGFVAGAAEEIVLIADVGALPRPLVNDLRCVRNVGPLGTKLAAVTGDVTLGYVELALLSTTERVPRGGWADIANLLVEPKHRRRGVGTWLIGQAAAWLELGRVHRLLAYVSDSAELAFHRSVGFEVLTRTTRGWVRL